MLKRGIVEPTAANAATMETTAETNASRRSTTKTLTTAATAPSRSGGAPPLLAACPPYGVQLDQTWRDGVYNGPRKRVKGWGVVAGAAKPYMMADAPDAEDAPQAKRGHHTAGHRNTSLSMDVRADWSEAYALVPSLQVGYVWYASIHTLEVLSGLERIGFELAGQIGLRGVIDDLRALQSRYGDRFRVAPALWQIASI